MIASMFHVQVPEQAVPGFERSWQQRAGRVDTMPGFRGLEVLRDGSQPGKYIVLTHWETRADFEGWANSPEFNAAHAHRQPSNQADQADQTGTTGAQGGGIEFYEVLVHG